MDATDLRHTHSKARTTASPPFYIFFSFYSHDINPLPLPTDSISSSLLPQQSPHPADYLGDNRDTESSALAANNRPLDRVSDAYTA